MIQPMPDSPGDGLLVEQLQAGDLDALGVLYERHKGLVYRTALAITQDPLAAEDILQDGFLRLHKYAHRVDTSLPLEPWLYRVTVNLAYSWASRVKRWLHTLQYMVDRWTVSVQWNPETTAEEQERRQILQQAIDALPPRHRVVIILYYLEELSLKEIAYVTGVPEGTVKSRLHYARQKLRKAILEQDRQLVPEVAYDFT